MLICPWGWVEDPTYERAKAVRAEGAKGTERSFTPLCDVRQRQWSSQRGEINSISETEKGGADDLFAEVFEEKESLAKLTSIVEKARVSVGNESSTLPLVLNALFCQLEIMWKLLISLLGDIPSSDTPYVL